MHDQHNRLSEGQQSGNMQARFGQNRPAPSFMPASVAVNEPEVQEDAVAQDMAQPSAYEAPLQPNAGASNNLRHVDQLDETAPPLPHSERSEYIIPVEEILIRLREANIEKSKDTVQRYCREGSLDCKKLGLFKRFFATEKSLVVLLKKMQPDEDARNCIKVHEVASTKNVVETKDTDAPASNRAQVQPTAEETGPEETAKTITPEEDQGLVSFLKEEIRVKNKQLEVKDTQIAAMLERDHETNILIRGLQNQLGETFAMLAGRSNRKEGNASEVHDV